MDTHLESKLIECLDALAQGESIERILARYPQEAVQLRPLLETAAGLAALRLEPSEAARLQSRQRFMAQADLLRRTKQRKPLGFLPRLATGFIAAALVAAVLGTGAVAASGSALPGDPLYGLKRTVEEVQLNTASSPAQRQELQREFEQRRRNETNELLDAGRAGEVEFTGTIEAMQPRAWIVSSLVVQLDANTQIAGTPQINRVAEVRGATGPQGLRASSISIESAGEAEMTPTPEATDRPQATETPEPAEPAAPLTTATPQPATTRQPAATPRPTATGKPTAAAQPTAAAPQPTEVEFTGSVNSIGEGIWNIDGTLVSVNDDTEIQGTITAGQRVKVKVLRFADDRLVAVRIELSEDGGGSAANGNDGQNLNENRNGNEGDSADNGGNADDNSNSDNTENSGSSNNNDDGDNANGNDNSGSRNGNDDQSENGNGN